jgi:hypothetical protein
VSERLRRCSGSLNPPRAYKHRGAVTMNTFWLVESSYYYDGTIAARLAGSIRAEERPDDEKLSASERDIHREWFDSRRLAEQLVESVRESAPVYRCGGRREGRAGCVRVCGRREMPSVGLVGGSW